MISWGHLGPERGLLSEIEQGSPATSNLKRISHSTGTVREAESRTALTWLQESCPLSLVEATGYFVQDLVETLIGLLGAQPAR